MAFRRRGSGADNVGDGGPRKMGGMGSNIRGMRDVLDSVEPLNNESMSAAGPKGNSQVASATPDLQVNPSKFTNNPVSGKGAGVSKLSNSHETTQVPGNASRPSLGDKTSGHPTSPAAKGHGLMSRKKMRKAFGLEMPMQSGNSRGSSTGSRAARQTPFVSNKGFAGTTKTYATKTNTMKPATKGY